MSLVVKDPKSNKQISATLISEQKRHSELPAPNRFLKTQVAADLKFNAIDYPLKVAAESSAEGIKIDNGATLEKSYNVLEKHNTRYLDIVNGKIDFGTYPASVRLNFGMTTSSAKLPEMGTHAEIMNVSQTIHSGDLALIALGLTPPMDFTASENDDLRTDCNDKITTYVASEDAWQAAVSTLAIRKSICLTLTTTVRKAVQFNVSGDTEEEMRTYARTFGIKFATEKPETEIDVLALFADGSGIAAGTIVRIGKLYTSENKIKKIDSVKGVTATVNAHGEAILDTTQTGSDLFVIWECAGCVSGSMPITIVSGEDQSLTVHVVKNPAQP